MPENSQSTNQDDHGAAPPSEEPGPAFKAMEEEMMARLQQLQAEMAPALEALDQRLSPLLEDLHAQAKPMLEEVEQRLSPFLEQLQKAIQEVTSSPAPGDGEAKKNEDSSAG